MNTLPSIKIWITIDTEYCYTLVTMAEKIYKYTVFSGILVLLTVLSFSAVLIRAQSSLTIANITHNGSTYPNSQIPIYEKFEITFQVTTNASPGPNPQLPYIASPPPGFSPSDNPKYAGISVDAVFTAPDGQSYQQPAFIYQPYQQLSNGPYPIGGKVWKVRFAPHLPGNWSYYLKAKDASGNTSTVQTPRTFTVTDSANKGFIRVSQNDPRYFEFSDGSYFPAIGRHARTTYDTPGSGDRSDYLEYGQNGITLVRDWMSGFYGSAWLYWRDGRNPYDFYLPRTGLEGYTDPQTGKERLTMVLAEGNGWYYSCRREDLSAPHQVEAIKTNTYYKISSTYQASGITGPRNSNYSNYGYVLKVGGWEDNCQNPGGLPTVTNYGGNNSQWSTVSGTWGSGSNTEARVHLALENANNGKVWIKDISLKECLDGQSCTTLGPEILTEPSGEYETYYPERSAYEIDQAVQAAKDAGIYLKLVVGDKSDMMWWKMQNDGTFVAKPGEEDDQLGFYGQGRTIDKKRMLWDAYFRYLQARWGYSTNIHSWEVTNEGVPTIQHYELTDEMAKVMRCRAFDVEIPGDLINNRYSDGKKCTYQHPNSHIVTTSFDHSLYPFWLEANYPNVDYGDVHAYSSSTGWLSGDTLTWYDAAYYHIAYSQNIASSLAGYPIQKPVIRGEAGIDINGIQNEASALQNDTTGVWLHNYLWASLHPGGLMELYWWGETIDANNLNSIYKQFNQFLSTLPLNNGHYQDIAATSSNTNIRVVGQKDLVNGNAHFWVLNKNHTWKNVVDGVNSGSVTGTITMSGFQPNKQYTLEEWNTYNGTKTTGTTTSSGTGTISLSISILTTDTAFKITHPDAPPVTPTMPVLTATPSLAPVSGDVNGDGSVDLSDLSILLSNYGKSDMQRINGDLNNDGTVNLLDLTTLLANFGKSS